MRNLTGWPAMGAVGSIRNRAVTPVFWFSQALPAGMLGIPVGGGVLGHGTPGGRVTVGPVAAGGLVVVVDLVAALVVVVAAAGAGVDVETGAGATLITGDSAGAPSSSSSNAPRPVAPALGAAAIVVDAPTVHGRSRPARCRAGG